MGINAESQLDKSRKNLQELGKALPNLVNSSADIFENPEIRSRLEAFRQAYQEASQRLEKPNFSIAMIGTTSSGKSTIVNALIGRKIAPIEAGEMSGGVLTLQHSNEQTLIVEETKGATWETGSWSGLSDETLYEKIRSVMFAYHNTRKKQDCIAPKLTAFVPILPAASPKLLGLPPGVGVELIDLPGLKSIQDRDNLKIIQERVHKAFSIVVIDYSQVDEQHRKQLLEELKRVVEHLQGRTESMIFVLNRVDQRGADDLPIAERIEKLREEIKSVLFLQEPPDILPFNARLLYYAQCAWGSVSLAQDSPVDRDTRLKFLKAMFLDCQGTISRHTDEKEQLSDLFYNIRKQVNKENHIPDGQMKQIMQYALEWSGGSQLWSCLRKRVQESFSEIVIRPALIEVFDTYDSLEKTLDLLIKTRKVNNQEQVELEREKIKKIRGDLQKNIQKIDKYFQTEIKDYIEELKTNDSKARIRVKKDAEKKGRKGFQAIFNAVNEVEGDLTQVLIVPVRDALKNNQGTYELEDKLREVITPASAKDIAGAYDNVSRRLNNFTNESGYLIKRVRNDDSKGVKELEHDERYIRLLYHTMRQALSARAEFSLQAKARQFEQALESLVDEQLKRLKVCFAEKAFSSLDIDKAVISELRKNLAQNPPTLPESFFELPTEVKQQDTEETEVIDKKQKNVSYTEGSCLSKKTKTRTEWEDVKGKVKYKELILPDIDGMAKQWSSGIEKGKEKLWHTLQDWILKRLDYVGELFEESVNDITDLAERVLQEQSKIIEQNFEVEMQRWQNFEREKDAVTKICRELRETLTSSYMD